ncbi:VOC family protein [Angustibacter sp. McL0619]|uniref:VOC family protein n=1 Tax=Angustibacter sp. McL0619 TaxID=3415676 RepID=UPI003CE6CBC2
MITITAEQLVKAGHEQAVDALMADLTTDIMQQEPGCVRFDYVVEPQNPRRRLVIESYRDRAALETHQRAPYLATFIPLLLEHLDEPPAVVQFVDAFNQARSAPYFHTGIVVDDLEEAVKYYSDSLGVRFTEPGTFDIPRLEDPDPHPFELTAVLSMTEAPFLELIQAAGDGIISADKCGQIFYHGYWEDDMDARLERLTEPGAPGVEAVFRMEQGSTPFAIITRPDRYGTRIEYVGAQAADPLTAWARTGVLPDGIGA